MEIKRTTEIFIETKRRLVVHRTETAEQIICPECSAPMLAAEQLAALLGISRRCVYRIVERGAAHFAETGNGILFVCPDSLEENLIIGEENL